jgi:hypothetical protein
MTTARVDVLQDGANRDSPGPFAGRMRCVWPTVVPLVLLHGSPPEFPTGLLVKAWRSDPNIDIDVEFHGRGHTGPMQVRRSPA